MMKHAQNITKQDRPEPCSFRDSSLTFAVIWDPENGLEAFSSETLFDNSGDFAQTKPVFESHPIKSDFGDFDEPFAVFGSRQLHFIDIRSSKLYEKCVAGDFDNTSLRSNSNYSSSAVSRSNFPYSHFPVSTICQSCYSTDEPVNCFTSIPSTHVGDGEQSISKCRKIVYALFSSTSAHRLF